METPAPRPRAYLTTCSPTPPPAYRDLGPGYHQARTDKDKKIKNHIRQIEALLGHPITITNAA